MASRKDVLNKEDVLFKTNNGLEIYQNELKLVKKGYNLVGLCCFHDEKTPSFNIFPNGRFKCFGCGESGDIFDFVMKRHFLTFPEALKYVNDKIPYNNLKVVKTGLKEVKISKKNAVIEFKDCPFEDKHRIYWGKYELDEAFLRENSVFAVSLWSINGKVIKVPENRAVFAYEHEKGVKILQIGKDVKKSEKWFNTVPNTELWLYPKECCNQLWVVKSLKDALCLKKHFGFCVCAVQNEDWRHLDKNMPKLLEVAKDIVICYGSDAMGVENCKIVQKKYNTKYFNTPKYMLKYGVQDVSDCIAEFGLEIVKKELKKKGFL